MLTTRRSHLALIGACALPFAFAFGCSSSGGSADGGDGAASDAASTTTDGAGSPSDGGTTSDGGNSPLTFQTSNVPVAIFQPSPDDLVINGANCSGHSTAEINTDKGTINCAGLVAGTNFRYLPIPQR